MVIDQLDVDNEESIKQYIAKVKDSVNTLINNAGIMLNDRVTNTTKEDLVKTFEINTVAPLLLTQHFYNNQLFEKGALVVNISSILGSIDWTNSWSVENMSASYFISKAALNMVSKIQSLALKDVNVIPIHPGWLKTDLGGQSAPLDVATGVAGIINVIEKFDPKTQNGAFWQFDGESLKW